MFKFITSKPLWVNIVFAIGMVVVVFFSILQLLGIITKHGQYLTVPSVIGKKTTDAIKLLEDRGFEVLIQDSIYTDTAKRGIVLKQLPDPNSTVKVNRTVLLTVNRVTLPLVDVPALQGKTLGFALELLKRSHLTLGDTTFRPDFMQGSVLEQNYNGTIVAAGAKIPWGSKINLVVGSGLAEEKMLVPDLIGLRFDSAKVLLEQQGILLGAVIHDPGITDTAAAFIWKQMPPDFDEFKQPVYIQSGQLIDIWISREMKLESDSTNNRLKKTSTNK